MRQTPGLPIRWESTTDAQEQKRMSVGDAIGDLPGLRSRLSSKDGDDFDRWIEHASSPRLSLKNIKPIGSLTRDITRVIRESAGDLEGRSPRQTGSEFVRSKLSGNPLQDWYYDPRLNGVCNHSARSHMGSDLSVL